VPLRVLLIIFSSSAWIPVFTVNDGKMVLCATSVAPENNISYHIPVIQMAEFVCVATCYLLHPEFEVRSHKVSRSKYW
jgi:hypothetical protein